MKTIQDSVEVLSGVGAKRLESLHSLGIYSIYDLVTHFPFRYEDIQVRSLDEIEDQEKVTLKGRVVTQPVVQHYGYRKSRLSFKLAMEHAVIGVTFFNQPYLKDKIYLEEEIAIFGKWDSMRQNLGGFKILGSSTNQENQDFESVYHVNKSIKQKTLLTLIEKAIEEMAKDLFVPYPLALIKINDMITEIVYLKNKESYHVLDDDSSDT